MFVNIPAAAGVRSTIFASKRHLAVLCWLSTTVASDLQPFIRFTAQAAATSTLSMNLLWQFCRHVQHDQAFVTSVAH
jgi:hypothetical protein